MRRVTRAGLMVAFAGSAASAQTSTIFNEVSADGGNTWLSSASVLPGATVQVRIRCQFVGTQTTLGFAGLTMQPVLNSWRPASGDVCAPFTFPGVDNFGTETGFGQPTTETSYQGKPVFNTPANTGRMFPFGWTNQSLASSSGLITSFNDTGERLRFAGSKNTTGTTNPAWGVVSAQTQANELGSYFVASRNVVLFKYTVTLGSAPTSRTLVADTPTSLMPFSVTRWYRFSNGGLLIDAPISSVSAANIHVIPAPATCGLLCGAVVVSARRRRTHPSNCDLARM